MRSGVSAVTSCGTNACWNINLKLYEKTPGGRGLEMPLTPTSKIRRTSSQIKKRSERERKQREKMDNVMIKRWEWYEEHKKNQGKEKYGETPNKGASEHGISLPDNEFFTENNPLRADECKEIDYQETIDRNVKNFRRRVIDPLARFNMDTMIEDTASSHDAVLKGRKSYYRTWKQPVRLVIKRYI